jgi:hypothetical protein
MVTDIMQADLRGNMLDSEGQRAKPCLRYVS